MDTKNHFGGTERYEDVSDAPKERKKMDENNQRAKGLAKHETVLYLTLNESRLKKKKISQIKK